MYDDSTNAIKMPEEANFPSFFSFKESCKNHLSGNKVGRKEGKLQFVVPFEQFAVRKVTVLRES